MSSNIINLLWESFLETILMVGVSGGLGAAIGIPLGPSRTSTASSALL